MMVEYPDVLKVDHVLDSCRYKYFITIKKI